MALACRRCGSDCVVPMLRQSTGKMPVSPSATLPFVGDFVALQKLFEAPPAERPIPHDAADAAAAGTVRRLEMLAGVREQDDARSQKRSPYSCASFGD